jgi:uncharacterized phage protein (TIGR02218 family)
MKQCSDALKSLLNDYMAGRRRTWYIADLYTFWLKMDISYNSGYFNSGTILLRTGHDVDLSVGENIYKHETISHGDITDTLGVETTDMDLSIVYNPYDIIPELNVSWVQALQGGTFDGAYVSLDRLYSPMPWQYNMPNLSTDYVLKARFFGRIDVEEVKFTQASLKVKSPTDLLNTQLPRNLIKPSCLNRFCDSACGLTKSTYEKHVTAVSGSTKAKIKIASGYANGYFTAGTMLCTSGANIGVSRSIKTFKNNIATPAQPFANAVAVGDTFTFWRGCAKTRSVCKNTYNNLSHFRGFPFIPCQNVLL